jgi:hypothetical protein
LLRHARSVSLQSNSMWLLLEILFMLVEVCQFWRLFLTLVVGMAVVGLGDWLLPVGSGWRDLDIPLLVISLIGGGVWECRQQVRKME